MKKALTLILALVLCLSLVSVAAFAAEYDYVTVTGTMNGWNASSEADRMTKVSDGVYTITYEVMPAGSYEFKFTANGNWSDLDKGGTFLGSGQDCKLVQAGANIQFTLDKACQVVIDLDLNNNTFCITIDGQVDDPVEIPVIKVHVSVPEDWGDVYVYVWNPNHLGAWAGTKVDNGIIEIPANFEGLIVNNNNGRQTADIKDIDLTKEEVWVVVDSYNGYTLHYTDPGDVEEEPVANIKIHVIAPESWEQVYAYTYNPEHLGTWPGSLLEGDTFELPAVFQGLIFHNNNGVQTADITDIDRTKAEVWITVSELGAYSISYTEPQQGGEEPEPAQIKIHVISNWANVYAYTYNPELTGTWPGTKAENGSFETLACFSGLVLNNGEGQQTWDITDIDMTAGEVWIVVGAADEYGKFSYKLYYSEPNLEEPPLTGDNTVVVFAVMLLAASTCAVTLLSKKKYF